MIEAHEAALRFGGHPGIRDLALIKSAIGRPYTGYYPRVHQKAAALLQSLARNHGFIDGNKRTAFLIVDLFLQRSGYRLRGLNEDPDRALEDFVLSVVQHNTSQQDIAAWFKARIAR